MTDTIKNAMVSAAGFDKRLQHIIGNLPTSPWLKLQVKPVRNCYIGPKQAKRYSKHLY
ncbi:MAG: hypothetical protein MRQ13_04685 [Candidatus Midichloria sp.]|nr:hypothetical protein [Candidatus Midichloria sp.]